MYQISGVENKYEGDKIFPVLNDCIRVVYDTGGSRLEFRNMKSMIVANGP